MKRATIVCLTHTLVGWLFLLSATAVVVLPNTGHWILEERPKETTDALVKFL